MLTTDPIVETRIRRLAITPFVAEAPSIPHPPDTVPPQDDVAVALHVSLSRCGLDSANDSAPLTAPFAIIPIIPNFPFFYVLWRAWSHYKAWKGAEYLEDLLKLGMIVEKPSKDLDAVYQSKGAVAVEGGENIAPDETFSEGVKLGKTSGKGYKVDEQVKRDGEKLVKQAKGEVGAIDGTATPKSMVYDGKDDAEVLDDSTLSSARHPGILLSPRQVPVLARTFDFRPHEIIDVNRAVEQAEIRARAADEKNAKP